jgi:hypothetical protein
MTPIKRCETVRFVIGQNESPIAVRPQHRRTPSSRARQSQFAEARKKAGLVPTKD